MWETLGWIGLAACVIAALLLGYSFWDWVLTR